MCCVLKQVLISIDNRDKNKYSRIIHESSLYLIDILKQSVYTDISNPVSVDTGTFTAIEYIAVVFRN